MALASAQRSADLATGSIFFIGNATVLIRYAGFTILTDPTFIHKHGEVPPRLRPDNEEAYGSRSRYS
jgi:L-ascorbate metabolism protein UlaG (beta-lactamase superfamily)